MYFAKSPRCLLWMTQPKDALWGSKAHPELDPAWMAFQTREVERQLRPVHPSPGRKYSRNRFVAPASRTIRRSAPVSASAQIAMDRTPSKASDTGPTKSLTPGNEKKAL